MLSSVKKDKKHRVAVKRFEIKRLQAKAFSQDLFLKNRLSLRAQEAVFQKATHKRAWYLSEQLQLRYTAKQCSSAFITQNLLAKNSLSLILRNSSKTRVKNRCIETGRSRSVLRFCKLSRIVLREKASKGVIPGMSKASW